MKYFFSISLLLIIFLVSCQSIDKSITTEADGDQIPVTDPTRPVSQNSDGAPAETISDSVPVQSEIAMPSPNMAIFQDYLNLIREPSRDSDQVVLEGTVLAIEQNELCPYQEESCSIPTYPNDWGMVRIDAILPDPNTSGSIGDSAAGEAEGGEGRTSGQNQGVDLPDKAHPELQVGQEVQAQFLLTTRPAVARWELAVPEDNNFERANAPETAEESDPDYQPLLFENGRYVFTVGTSSTDQIEEKVLPGLVVGDRFRAVVSYDGIVRIFVYERLP